jgi:hypothetical protein
MLRSRRLVWLALILLATLPLFGVDRSAFTFTHYDLRANLRPDQRALDVEGTIEVRNDSAAPQSAIPLQISSSLTWLRVSIGDEQPSWISQTYTSDIDHTGALSEAIITLDKPLAPKASLKISVHYAGTVTRDSTRLTRIGTPQDVAERSDWDQIGQNFTAVRGLGYVTWYPVSIDAVSLSNGDEVFDALASWKQRHRESKFQAFLGISAVPAESSLKLVTNALHTTAGTTTRGSSGAPAQLEFGLDGTPTFILGNLTAIDREHLTIYAAPEHTSLARDYVVAAEKAQTTVAAWFGEPRQKAVIVELADEDALPFEVGPYLFTPLKNVPPLALEVALARTLTHASFDSRRPWVREGLAGFAQSLIREQQQGRKAGLAYLNQFVNALSVAESQTQSTAKPDESSSKTQLPSIGPQPLLSTNDELFYRTKAAFVWSMLRDMLRDDAIKTFISRYRAADDKDGSYVQHLLENAGSTHRDLEQFFDDWVYRDRGLPELHIASAFPRELVPQAGSTKPNYVVAVTVENTGSAWVEVPIVVRTGKDERSVRVAVPARSKAVARVPFPAVPDEVIVNDGSIPEADVTDNRFALPNAFEKQRK